MERKESSGRRVKNLRNNREELSGAPPPSPGRSRGRLSPGWIRLGPEHGVNLFLSSLPNGLCQRAPPPALPRSSGGTGGEDGDWPGESCSGVGRRRFPPGPPPVSRPSTPGLNHPGLQVVNRCIKPPFPFKARQTVGRRACGPSGPLFGNVCAHNKPDGQRFIAVFISWGWFGLLPLCTAPTPPTRAAFTDLW